VARPKSGAKPPGLHRLPDRILVDIGQDPGSIRRSSWTEHMQWVIRHIGPTRS